MSAARYAVYFAPAVDSPWWRFGAHWLGWDEQRAAPLPQPALPAWSVAEFHALTAEPRRYGFHATLKAPFRLRAGATEELLRTRFAVLASRLRIQPLGHLVPRTMDGFVALVPGPRQPAVDTLAARCVLELDDLRAPLSAAEIERRQPDSLDPLARQLLQRHGYPHVLDRFRFHMTLSGPVDATTADLLVRAAAERTTPLNATSPPLLDRICLFREDHPGAPFLRLQDERVRR